MQIFSGRLKLFRWLIRMHAAANVGMNAKQIIRDRYFQTAPYMQQTGLPSTAGPLQRF
jgi:hypothetical protein